MIELEMSSYVYLIYYGCLYLIYKFYNKNCVYLLYYFNMIYIYCIYLCVNYFYNYLNVQIFNILYKIDIYRRYGIFIINFIIYFMI